MLFSQHQIEVYSSIETFTILSVFILFCLNNFHQQIMSLTALQFGSNLFENIEWTPRIYMNICLFGIFAIEMFDQQPNSSKDKIQSGDDFSFDLQQQILEVGSGVGMFVFHFWKYYPILKGKPLTYREIISFTSIIIGFIFRKYCKIHLGRFFTYSITVKNDHKIVNTGPYSIVRHPSYTGALMMHWGYGFWFNNPLSYLMFNVGILNFMRTRIPKEEEILKDNTDGEYIKYCENVRYRLIPYIY